MFLVMRGGEVGAAVIADCQSTWIRTPGRSIALIVPTEEMPFEITFSPAGSALVRRSSLVT